jgi:hypothetical protein
MTLNIVTLSNAVRSSVDKSDTGYFSQIVDRNFPLLGFVEMFDLHLPSYIYSNRWLWLCVWVFVANLHKLKYLRYRALSCLTMCSRMTIITANRIPASAVHFNVRVYSVHWTHVWHIVMISSPPYILRSFWVRSCPCHSLREVIRRHTFGAEYKLWSFITSFPPQYVQVRCPLWSFIIRCSPYTSQCGGQPFVGWSRLLFST